MNAIEPVQRIRKKQIIGWLYDVCVWEGENNDWEYQSISHIFGMIFGGQYTVIWLIQHILSSRAISKMTLLLPIDNVDRNWMISLLV